MSESCASPSKCCSKKQVEVISGIYMRIFEVCSMLLVHGTGQDDFVVVVEV